MWQSRAFVFAYLLLSLFIFIKEVNLYSKERNDVIVEYRADNILRFVKYLIAKDEYYRAYTELIRLNSYYPEYIKQDQFHITELYLYYKGNRHTEILEGRFDTGDRDVESIINLFKTDVYLSRSEFQKADYLLESNLYRGIDEEINLYFYKRMFLSNLLLMRIDKARKILADRQSIIRRDIDLDIYIEAIQYSDDCFRSLKRDYNSLLMGIVPGMGYASSGRKYTGIIAFIVVSTLSALTYVSFRTDNKPLGIFFSIPTAVFYSGSILGGYLASKRHNSAVMGNLKENLFTKMDLSEDREKIFKDYGIVNVR